MTGALAHLETCKSRASIAIECCPNTEDLLSGYNAVKQDNHHTVLHATICQTCICIRYEPKVFAFCRSSSNIAVVQESCSSMVLQFKLPSNAKRCPYILHKAILVPSSPPKLRLPSNAVPQCAYR
jgi:hypothetical protein